MCIRDRVGSIIGYYFGEASVTTLNNAKGTTTGGGEAIAPDDPDVLDIDIAGAPPNGGQ